MSTSTNIQSITSLPFRALLAGAIVVIISSSLTSVAAAAESGDTPQVTVRFADLDISTSQGSVRLYRRIHAAAEDVCSRMYYSVDSYGRHKNACLKKVVADAVTKVNEPALSAVFASSYGVAAPVVLAAAAGTR
jgi:UrcA family protein